MKTIVINVRHLDKYPVKTKKGFLSDRYVYIGRPTKWGNPFQIGRDGTRQEVIEKYKEYLLKNPKLIKQARQELKGKILGCFCKPLSCHGDVLIEFIKGKNNENI